MLWLFGASLLSVLVWYAALGVWFAIYRQPIMSRSAVEAISWITLGGFTAVIYAVTVRQSKWLFDLPSKARWVSAVAIALVLTYGFIMLFNLAFTVYAGW